MGSKAKKAAEVLKNEGAGALARRSLRFVRMRMHYTRCVFKMRRLYGRPIEESLDFAFNECPGFIGPMQKRSEITKLLAEVSKSKPKRILEIGTANGGTLFLISKAAPADALMVSLDLPGGRFGGGYPAWKIPIYKMFANGRQKIKLVRADSHRPESLENVRAALGGKADFLFIDGDHTYEGVKKDFEMYRTLVKEGGTIALHDIVPHPRETGCNVFDFWKELRESHDHREFVENWKQKSCGIGLVVNREGGDARLKRMMGVIDSFKTDIKPSKYWLELNRRNLAQLESTGYENFKQTLALNYFTFILSPRDDQMRFLMKKLGKVASTMNLIKSIPLRGHDLLTWKQSIAYNYTARMLWDYAKPPLEEPLEGNPPKVFRCGKLISQDLANSYLESKSIGEGMPRPRTIMELGAGYGRNAFAMMKLMPSVKYIIVDIPPALYVAERYLTSVFPERKAFRWRQFKSFKEVKAEFECADMAFLTPDQLELMPGRAVDLFMTISSLQEMHPRQIGYYMKQAARLASHIYLKQWSVSRIPFDEITVTEKDYPIPAGWKKLYWRQCGVQTEFFEAMLKRQ